MSEVVKGFKVFKPDWTCKNKQYTCPGKFEEEGELEVCGHGMHFCKKAVDCFNYYQFNPTYKVAEVVAYGTVVEEGDKCCTDKLEIIREIPWQELLEIVNTGKSCTGIGNSGDYNSGNHNSGDYNSGNHNSGNHNSGDYNSGNCNSGDHNSGDHNSGDCNSGDYNSGDYNSGNCNSGNCNSGDCNSGDYNSGNHNSGNCNSGNHNSGHYNSGDYNKSSFNTGCFNTEEQKITFFNKPSDWTYNDWLCSEAKLLMHGMISDTTTKWIVSGNMTEEEKAEYPSHKTTGGYLKVLDKSECNQLWWDRLTDYQKNIIKQLPNFDAEIFEEITGIKTEQLEKR